MVYSISKITDTHCYCGILLIRLRNCCYTPCPYLYYRRMLRNRKVVQKRDKNIILTMYIRQTNHHPRGISTNTESPLKPTRGV